MVLLFLSVVLCSSKDILCFLLEGVLYLTCKSVDDNG